MIESAHLHSHDGARVDMLHLEHLAAGAVAQVGDLLEVLALELHLLRLLVPIDGDGPFQSARLVLLPLPLASVLARRLVAAVSEILEVIDF